MIHGKMKGNFINNIICIYKFFGEYLTRLYYLVKSWRISDQIILSCKIMANISLNYKILLIMSISCNGYEPCFLRNPSRTEICIFPMEYKDISHVLKKREDMR